jgi:nucleotide-binding universal stress UspA family protein
MNENFSQESLHQLTTRWFTPPGPSHRFKIYTDTSDFFGIEFGDIVVLNDTPYLIRHNAKEGRFGLDDEVKFWVKRAIDLNTGETRIIKLVFHEKFIARIGDIEFECFRSPRKEARILNMVKDHPNFMHGFSVQDEEGNIVRVLDMIYGKTLADHVRDIAGGTTHETYFYEHFPEILDNFIECIEAIGFLHDRGEKHGDIRRDHILTDRDTGRYRWIDFDYNFRHRENMFGYDLFGLGNVLMYLAGMGDVLLPDLRKAEHPALDKLSNGDVNIVFHNRVANLGKIYPYIPESLNRILMHFSKGANVFYDHTRQLLDDLREFKADFSKQREKSMKPVMNRNILIAVDESENARRAVEYVAGLLGGISGFKVFVLHIIVEPEEDFFSDKAEQDKWYQDHSHKAEQMLTGFRQILIDAGFAPDNVYTRSTLRCCPSLAECILAERDQLEYGTLVVGRKGVSPGEEFLFGSTSGKIVRIARNCTVWVVQ